MKGIVITTGNELCVQDFGEPLYQTIGKVVGGYIEIVHPKGLPEPCCTAPGRFCIERRHWLEAVLFHIWNRRSAVLRRLDGGYCT